MATIKKCWNYKKNYGKELLYKLHDHCSEEERIRLEERFKVLLQESRNRHNTCINRLRFKYIEFLEEQRVSDQRNYKLLEALDSVDNSLALMTARTDRLNILRKHYEAYLRRMCTVHADGVSEGSGRKADKYLRTDANERMNSLSPEGRGTLLLKSPRPSYQTIGSSFCSPSEAVKTPSQRTTAYDPDALQMYWKHDLQQLPKIRLSLPSGDRGFQQSRTPDNNNDIRLNDSDPRAESKLQSADRFDRFFTQGHLYLDAAKLPDLPSISQYPMDPSRRTQSLRSNPPNSYPNDNDSFPYPRASFQRKEYDPRCGNKEVRVEENEEKVPTGTNSEFDEYLEKIRKLHRDLDMQSSDDDGTRMMEQRAAASRGDSRASAKESFDKNLANDVKKVLELAENLVSRTRSGARHAEKEEEKLQSGASLAKRNHVEISDARQGRATSMAHATDRISGDVALHRPELDSRENIEKLKNQSFPGVDDPPEPRRDRPVHPGRDNDRIYVAEQSRLEQSLFSVGEALEPWNLASVEKQIRRIDFAEETAPDESDAMLIEQEIPASETVQEQEQEQEVIFDNTDDTLELQDNEYPGDQHEAGRTEDRYDEVPASLQPRVSEKEHVESPDGDDRFIEQKDFNDYDDYKDNDQEKSEAMGNEHEENVEGPSGEENLNGGYGYDQNEPYEYEKKEEYEGYAIQEYPQEPSEQYEGYTGEQYDQYIGHPESGYDDQPNAQYQEDANEKYGYPYNEQYEPNQEFTTNAEEHYEPGEAEIPRDGELELEEAKVDVVEEESTEQPRESQSEEKEVTEEKEVKEEKEEEEKKEKEDSVGTVSSKEDQSEMLASKNEQKKKKDVIKSLLDSDTDSTLEQNVTNTESDFDFN
ncbi:uncharacterized protein LOC117224288 isoform X1 [Megalopta genalis]|uniref:uncharacterized protein LOC117224288 isoform X1 n=1 Tax=Megalopta genalis TaxID=115081 RepID=UPI003FD2A0D7